MTRQRSTVMTSAPTVPIAPITTTLLMIENDRWDQQYAEKVEEKEGASVTLKGKRYPVAAVLGVRKMQIETTHKYSPELVPLAYFYWAIDDRGIDPWVAEYLNLGVKAEIAPPYHTKRDTPRYHFAIPKLHKIVCKGVANSDGNYTKVLEDHSFTAKPVSLDLLELEPDYSHPYATPPSTTATVSTRQLVFVYDELVKTTYQLGPDEKPTGSTDVRITFPPELLNQALIPSLLKGKVELDL